MDNLLIYLGQIQAIMLYDLLRHCTSHAIFVFRFSLVKISNYRIKKNRNVDFD